MENGIKKTGIHHLNPAENIEFFRINKPFFLEKVLTLALRYGIIESMKGGETDGQEKEKSPRAKT